jgi:hypothetical protein
MIQAWHGPSTGHRKGAYRGYVGRCKRKRQLGKLRRRCEDITMNLKEMRCGARTGVVWLKIGQVEGCFECDNELSGSIKCGKFLE